MICITFGRLGTGGGGAGTVAVALATEGAVCSRLGAAGAAAGVTAVVGLFVGASASRKARTEPRDRFVVAGVLVAVTDATTGLGRSGNWIELPDTFTLASTNHPPRTIRVVTNGRLA